VESWGRELASRRDELPGAEDLRFLGELRDVSMELAEELERLGEDEWVSVADWISMTAEGAINDAVKRCRLQRIPRGLCRVPKSVIEDLEEVDEAHREATGRRCTWLLGVKDPYTLTSALNDLTSCFHRVVEHYADVTEGYTREGKCLFRNPDPALKEACEVWNQLVEELHREGLYTEGNYEALYFRVDDGRAEIRVGETAGHLSHLDLNTGALEYYDVNDDVKRLAEELLEEKCGLTCEVTPEAVACKEATSENAECISRVMAGLSSARFRIYNQEDWWKEIPEECREIEDIVKREKCLLERKLDL